ncbi:MAG: tetratricopeptide (TPR) repeat protein [Gammaproteobacteria bacterium]|jgi:tetratricopeptide (TPR) repeat protein
MSSDISQRLQTGLEHHQSGRFQEAENIYQSILKDQPQHPDALHLLGVMAHQLGKSDIAVNLIEQAIKANPDEPNFYNNCGEAYRSLQKHELAISRYEQALAIKSDFAGAHNNLGNALKELGRLGEAITCYEQAIAISPDFPMAHNNLGIALKALDREEEAISAYELAIAIMPDYAEAHSNMGNALLALGHHDDAIKCYKRAISIMPDYAEAHSNMGNAFKALGEQKQAVSAYEQALLINPNFAMAHYNMGIALDELGRPDEAISCYEQALAINPGYAEAHNNLGFTLQELGRQDEAIRHYEQALAIKPDYAAAHLHLSMIVPGQEQVAVIKKLLDEPSLTEVDTSHYHFALGNIYHNLDMFDDAFKHFDKGNALKRLTFSYDSHDYTAYVDRLIETYSPDYLEEVAKYGSTSKLPVFIVGMPRSGTTLVEQILSSHPLVYGAGELVLIESIEKVIANKINAGTPYPECMSSINSAAIDRYSGEYLSETKQFSEDETRITDKNPGNFHRIGLIKTLFPGARIIHCQRNPLDTCTSIFFNYFVLGNEYSFDLDELGKYYLDYERLMTHWGNLFATDILAVQYEDLVSNQEKISRQLVEYLDLEWDDRCLDFHLNKRAVRTASSVQVRKPMYTHSVNRWKHYEKQLAPLLASLRLSSPGLP